MYNFLKLSLLCLISINLSGQCPTGNLEFNAQSQVDDFLVNYPNCTQISGDLLIQYADLDCVLFSLCETDIDDLTPLSNITTVTGKVVLKGNIVLSSLAGLQNITDLESFHVYENDILSQLNDSPQSNSVNQLRIYDNLVLDDISGIINLDVINSELWIYDNPQLMECSIEPICDYILGSGTTDIHDNSTGCNSEVEIEAECNSCISTNIFIYTQEDIDEFASDYPGCTTINGSLYIQEDLFFGGTEITDLTGISQITTVLGNLTISSTTLLSSLDGLENISSLSGGLQIQLNDELIDINAISNIDPTSITSLTVFSNSQLSECSITNICQYLALPGSASISLNSTDCNSIMEIEEKCQECLPNGITFSSQQEIDDFITSYPLCQSIGGNVLIQETNPGSIINLNGLNAITNINGDLIISVNNSLNDLTGLSSLQYIYGDFRVSSNMAPESFDGLQNLETIDGYLWIRDNNSLSSISALSNLISLGGQLYLYNNDALISLQGLENLETINGDIQIWNNYGLSDVSSLNGISSSVHSISFFNNFSLTEISSLNNISTVSGEVRITNNNSIINIHGLNQINHVNSDLRITDNPNLETVNGFQVLNSVGGDFLLEQNTNLSNITGSNSIISIGGNLRLYDNDLLQSLDDFSSLNSIGGDLYINNNDILSSISDLSNITNVGGSITIANSDALLSASGLENITSVSGNFQIWDNGLLTNLADFSNLTSIDGDVYIGYHNSMSSLNGLEGVTSIGGYLWIANNPLLTDISGIKNIDPSTISSVPFDLRISDNPMLSICEVTSVCGVLDIPSSVTEIENNSNGCNTVQEVDLACAAILPVTYSQDLSCSVLNKQIDLTFSIAQQINNSHFEIEHSIDGRRFENIGQILGSGNTSAEKSYQYAHDTPNSGINYYRIKQVDYDGNYSFSNVASASIKISGKVNLYPNPMSDQLNVVAEDKLSFVIRNINGLTIFTGNTQDDSTIDLQSFGEGIYTIQFANGKVERLVKI